MVILQQTEPDFTPNFLHTPFNKVYDVIFDLIQLELLFGPPILRIVLHTQLL